MKRQPIDVLSLVVGVSALLVGASLLWATFIATPTALVVKVAVPVALVIIGIIGLLAARN